MALPFAAIGSKLLAGAKAAGKGALAAGKFAGGAVVKSAPVAGPLIGGIASYSDALAQSDRFEGAADRALLRGDMDVASMNASDLFRRALATKDFGRQLGAARVASFASGTSGTGVLEASVDEFESQMEGDVLSSRLRNAMRLLGAADENERFRFQAKAAKRSGQLGLLGSLFEGAGGFAK